MLFLKMIHIINIYFNKKKYNFSYIFTLASNSIRYVTQNLEFQNINVNKVESLVIESRLVFLLLLRTMYLIYNLSF